MKLNEIVELRLDELKVVCKKKCYTILQKPGKALYGEDAI